jgi:hypothetical protein
MTTLTATRINLQTACDYPECSEFAWPLYRQLSKGYEECAVLPLTSLNEWREQHRTARKRALRARRRGYRFAIIERHERADEIRAINLSAPVRQGRPMSAGYHAEPTRSPLPIYPCQHHGVHTYGAETSSGELVAYLWVYRAGDLALISQVLGHAAYLKDEVMWLLVEEMVAAEAPWGGFAVYNRWDSGGPGLQWFKQHTGFVRTEVEWSQW